MFRISARCAPASLSLCGARLEILQWISSETRLSGARFPGASV
jgi:hypothetical protein